MTTQISEQVVEQIRGANDVVEVVEEYVQLTRRGKNYFGLCPFHEEKTPSFSVVKDKQLFHCFGCGKGGNVFSFIMEIEQLTYVEAVQFLAKRVNLEIPNIIRYEQTYSNETNQLLSAYDWLVKYYHHLLKYADHGEEALRYLEKRGITNETIEQFQIGFAPHDSELTVQFLKQKEFSLPFLAKNSLLNLISDTNYLDPFRGRVVFPIQNHAGKTVAFGGRTLLDEQPKYLNSQEHKLFQKSNLLYNFYEARSHMRKQNEVIIFEGYFDVIAAHQAGVKNVVATLGTALTNAQARIIRRTVDKAIICYDGDDAGLEASYEAANMLQQIGCQVRISQLASGEDPDDYIKEHGGKLFLQKIIEQSDTFIKFFMRFKKHQYNLTVDSERIEYIQEIVNEIAKLKSPIEREYYIQEIAKQFQLSESVISQDVENVRNKLIDHKKNNSSRNSNTNINIDYRVQTLLPAYLRAEKSLITQMITFPSIIEQVQTELGINFNQMEHQVIVTHLYALYEEKSSIDVSELVDKVDEEEIKQLITELSVANTNKQLNENELKDYIQVIKNESTHMNYLRSLKQKQKLEKNPILAAKIGMQIIELKRKMNN